MQQAPIGVFDSGIGGLSVLRQLLQQLPHEHFVYLADMAYAPYGERSSADIQQRCLQVAHYLVRTHHIKALVVACNTATAQAVALLRQQFKHLPIIAIEPAIKPAAALSQTKHIGILATQGTLNSAKFQALAAQWQPHCHIRTQACTGLSLAIENMLDTPAQSNNADNLHTLCQRYINALRPLVTDDAKTGLDTIVLGCTHYPFATDTLQALAGHGVHFIDPSLSVAKHTKNILQQHGLCTHTAPTNLTLLATAAPQRLNQAASKWLNKPQTAQLVAL